MSQYVLLKCIPQLVTGRYFFHFLQVRSFVIVGRLGEHLRDVPQPLQGVIGVTTGGIDRYETERTRSDVRVRVLSLSAAQASHGGMHEPSFASAIDYWSQSK